MDVHQGGATTPVAPSNIPELSCLRYGAKFGQPVELVEGAFIGRKSGPGSWAKISNSEVQYPTPTIYTSRKPKREPFRFSLDSRVLAHKPPIPQKQTDKEQFHTQTDTNQPLYNSTGFSQTLQVKKDSLKVGSSNSNVTPNGLWNQHSFSSATLRSKSTSGQTGVIDLTSEFQSMKRDHDELFQDDDFFPQETTGPDVQQPSPDFGEFDDQLFSEINIDQMVWCYSA